MKAILLQPFALLACATALSAQVPAGPEFQVNTYTFGSQGPSLGGALEMDAAGHAVIVWNGNGPNSSRPITARRFDAAGNLEPEFVVFGPVPYGGNGASVAVDRRGDFVVAWHFADNTAYDIYARRYDRAGSAVGQPFQVNTHTTSTQEQPRVAADAVGNFVVVWTDHWGDGNSDGVFGQLYDASATPRGGQFLVNTYTTDQQSHPSVAYDGRGDFVVVWISWRQDGSYGGVFGQRYLASGARVGSEFAVNNTTADSQSWPRVAADRAGNFIVVWSDESGLDGDGDGVMGRLYDAAGAPRGPEFRVNGYTTGDQYLAGADFDDTGNFVVVWDSRGGQDGDRGGVFGQRFDAAGLRRGAEFRVNTYTTNYQGISSVASDGVGNFSVVWSSLDQDGHLVGTYAQRFGGIVPQALRVDIPGNGVLEPGEAREVRPTWRNVSGAVQTFSANLTRPGGPPGGVPQILDPAGAYGTVGDGASAECSACYVVQIPNPSIRPATHWDGSVVESIVPDAQGQRKEWLLHVGDSFTDVPRSSAFYRFIETLLHHSITGGCSATQYCPAGSATREQMAVFVLVAKEGTGYAPPACTTSRFRDVPPSSPFCPWIEELARRGVVSGCGVPDYCPSDPVTREQMAVFVLRTLESTLTPLACTTPVYNDVPATSPFCRWIEELTRRSVVSGCGGGNYCPTAAVTREQMGVFISVTFGLTLYGP